jgi:hypothetical protein
MQKSLKLSKTTATILEQSHSLNPGSSWDATSSMRRVIEENNSGHSLKKNVETTTGKVSESPGGIIAQTTSGNHPEQQQRASESVRENVESPGEKLDGRTDATSSAESPKSESEESLA